MVAKPTPALLRRHAAAMKIIHEVSADERLTLLSYVILGSERIDEVVAAAEAEKRPMPNARPRVPA